MTRTMLGFLSAAGDAIVTKIAHSTAVEYQCEGYRQLPDPSSMDDVPSGQGQTYTCTNIESLPVSGSLFRSAICNSMSSRKD